MILIKSDPNDGSHEMVKQYVKNMLYMNGILQEQNQCIIMIEDTGEFYPFCVEQGGKILYFGNTEQNMQVTKCKGLILAECNIPVVYCLADILKLAKSISDDLTNVRVIYKSYDKMEIENVMNRWEELEKDNGIGRREDIYHASGATR